MGHGMEKQTEKWSISKKIWMIQTRTICFHLFGQFNLAVATMPPHRSSQAWLATPDRSIAPCRATCADWATDGNSATVRQRKTYWRQCWNAANPTIVSKSFQRKEKKGILQHVHRSSKRSPVESTTFVIKHTHDIWKSWVGLRQEILR